MKLQVDDIREMISGTDELVFVYHKSSDKLYLSKNLQKLLDAGEVVREYWKSSPLWNGITQMNQERLVNMIRHEIWNHKSITYQVPVRLGSVGEEVLFELELWVIWGKKVNLEIEAVKGEMKRIS